MHQLSLQQYQQARQTRDPRFDGRFFVAVKTTGIFCRNICPVRMPKEVNVTYYDFAAQAMQAGFRPCLRCRPDSAPGSFAWQGTETTLHRAMHYLQRYPELKLSEICTRLGITDRYLRKLFQQFLGISPKHYQLSEQLLFAKRLLHETQLTIEEVAQSAGFNSSRRLQDHMTQHFRLSPTQVRQQQTPAKQKLSLMLPYHAPYHWQQVRDFLAVRAIEGVETVTETAYQRHFCWYFHKTPAITEKNTLAVQTLTSCSGEFIAEQCPEQHAFRVTIILSDYSQLNHIVRNIRRILDLDTDSQMICQQFVNAGVPEDELLSGIRLPGVWDVFEAGVRAILGQQVSIKAAITLVTRLVHHCGNTQQNRLQFPTPQQVAENSLDCLKMPQARKNALRALAEFVAQDQSQSVLASSPDAWLNLKGIGPWTVAYAKMRGLSDPDIWLNTDLVIKKQLQQHAINAELVMPWRSYLTFQLWNMAT